MLRSLRAAAAPQIREMSLSSFKVSFIALYSKKFRGRQSWHIAEHSAGTEASQQANRPGLRLHWRSPSLFTVS